MNHSSVKGLAAFNNLVGIKFQLYNSLFTALPFHRIEKTGILLSLLLNICEDGYARKQSPEQIIRMFFEKHTHYQNEREQYDLLFRLIQYIERQVVLFDALEDAAFTEVNDLNGPGTLKQLEAEVLQESEIEPLQERLRHFAIRLVLTAHPTQFYPGSVLGIINDLAQALKENDTVSINSYLQQLGKTAFFKKKKPTPYDEAMNLIWYLENVFYQAAGRILTQIKKQYPNLLPANNPLIVMGFWPGGDRDGNPFVNAATTLKVAEALRGSIIKSYYLEIRRMKRRLTFEGVEPILQELEADLYNNIFIPGKRTALQKEHILERLNQIRDILIHQHNGLFLHLVENLKNKVELFGLHFAALDIRQDSSIHARVIHALESTGQIPAVSYETMSDDQKQTWLTQITGSVTSLEYPEEVIADTIDSIHAVRSIQELNGEAGCNRYIISQCNSAINVLEVFALFRLCGWQEQALTLDIVPLFETIDDLKGAAAIMEQLYQLPAYRNHLQRRNNKQTIMLGFSDGTKDGGYLMANWSIYKAKESLTAISAQYQIDVLFFDGRGGPPSRGGGKTHKFYASMGSNISNREIQLTVQGQTVSSNFGTVAAAQFNMEQLLHAGISNQLFARGTTTLEAEEDALLAEMAQYSFEKYSALKNHPLFTEYLSEVSPLRFYSETNIGSRPAKRSSGNRLTLKDLRAIPYVGAWAQLKQNVTGHFGVGTALLRMEQAGKFEAVQKLYKRSTFFKTLLDNCEMAMKKSFFPLTEHLAQDEKFGTVWNLLYEEHLLTKNYVLKLSGKQSLMEDYPVEQVSIQMRERIVLPLLTIQQFALMRLRQFESQFHESPEKEVLEKLVVRCSFGIINAGRNSA